MQEIKKMFKHYVSTHIGSGVYQRMTDVQKQWLEQAYAAGVRDTTAKFEALIEKQAG